MSRITRRDVESVARLARLDLSDEEIEMFTAQLGDILDHAERISKLDTEGVAPTAHPFPLSNVLRPDVAVAGLDRDAVLAMAPSAEEQRFRVPRIIEHASGGDEKPSGDGGRPS